MVEIKKDNGGNGELKKEDNTTGKPESKSEATPPTDFKVAEIWIRGDQLCLDACAAFWNDRKQSIKTLMACIGILLDAEGKVKEDKPKIIIPNTGSPLNFLRNRLKGKK